MGDILYKAYRDKQAETYNLPKELADCFRYIDELEARVRELERKTTHQQELLVGIDAAYQADWIEITCPTKSIHEDVEKWFTEVHHAAVYTERGVDKGRTYLSKYERGGYGRAEGAKD
jgi:uncharacterized coiled-coil protein SlyX